MAGLQILDAKGNELVKGESRVRNEDDSDGGTFWGLGKHPDGEQTAQVLWPGCSLLSWELTTKRDGFYELPELTLIDTKED
jgi:hypothetical protein